MIKIIRGRGDSSGIDIHMKLNPNIVIRMKVDTSFGIGIPLQPCIGYWYRYLGIIQGVK